MAKKIELAKAYVQVIPTTEDIGSNLRDAFDVPAQQAGEEAGEKAGEGITSGIGGLVGKAALIGAVVAVGKKIGDTLKESINQYADFQQLTGGVETLFKDSADVVTQYAQEAFKTSGLSANEYMETVTGFSASLISSLDGDTAKAAELANQAIIDMSDNANKMGTDIEAIQNAYSGFARGNFTMLDNLSLGFAGSKEGMQQLLDKAKELSGVEYDISSYADIVEAIHVVQTEMGISGISAKEAADLVASGAMTEEEAFAKMGTTAKEASTTISGSMDSMKASWSNLLTAMSNPDANIDDAMKNFSESVKTYASNFLPTMLQAIKGSGDLISGLADMVIEMMPEFCEEVLPDLIESTIGLILNIVDSIVTSLPTIIDSIVNGLLSAENISLFIQGLIQLSSSIVAALPEIILALIEAIPTVIENIIEALVNPENFAIWVEGAVNVVTKLVENMPKILLGLLTAIPKIITTIVDTFTNTENLSKWLKIGSEAIDKIKEAFDGLPEKLKEAFNKAVEEWSKAWTNIKKKCGEITDKIKEAFTEFVGTIKQIGKDIASGLWNGIKSKKDWLKEKITGWVGGIGDAIKDFFKISSPSKLMAEYGRYIDEGLAQGITKNADITKNAMHKLGESALNGINVSGVANANVELAQSKPIGEARRLDKIEELLEQIAKGSDIYIDGNKLVGATANKMEKALDGINYNRERGVVYGY
jgi:phage-related protein